MLRQAPAGLAWACPGQQVHNLVPLHVRAGCGEHHKRHGKTGRLGLLFFDSQIDSTPMDCRCNYVVTCFDRTELQREAPWPSGFLHAFYLIHMFTCWSPHSSTQSLRRSFRVKVAQAIDACIEVRWSYWPACRTSSATLARVLSIPLNMQRRRRKDIASPHFV